MIHPKYRHCAAALLGLACLSAQATNLIKNSSFEKPLVEHDGYTFFTLHSHAIRGWTVVGAPGDVAIYSGIYFQDNLTFVPKRGEQWLNLAGTSHTATGVSQSVATIPGTSYTLTFYVGNVVDVGGFYGTNSTVNVLVDGQPLMTAVNTGGAGKTQQVWQQFTSTIVATTTKTTISFMNGDTSTDGSCGLDFVSLVPVVQE